MSENKKEKVINVGITKELTDFLDKWTQKSFEEKEEEKEEKPGLEVKRVIVEMAKKELEKINKEFEKDNITDEEWDRCIKKADKISDLVRWF